MTELCACNIFCVGFVTALAVADCGFGAVRGAGCVVIGNVVCKAVSKCRYCSGSSRNLVFAIIAVNNLVMSAVCRAGYRNNVFLYRCFGVVRRKTNLCGAIGALVPMSCGVACPACFGVGVRAGLCREGYGNGAIDRKTASVLFSFEFFIKSSFSLSELSEI